MSRSTPPPPACTDSGRPSPHGWQQLLQAVKSPSERDLLDVLARRAPGALAGVDELAAIATLEELEALAELVARAAAQHQPADAYERHKRRTRERQARLSLEGRDIGPLPPIADAERRAACERDLKLYLETYHASKFRLAWSEDHLRVLAKAQIVVLLGALFALAMPRGNGKTTICERTVLWAVTYGHHHYAMLISASESKAIKSLARIYRELVTNPLIADDFPEVSYALRRLEGIHNRAKGQLLDGRPTGIEIAKTKLVLPSVPGAPSSGAIIETGGLLSAVRGAQDLTLEGEVRRPTLILLDDPQTRESARSPEQSLVREEIIAADVLGMVGPDESIAALMTCTVIAPGDMADNLLDREKHPEWRGERTKLVYAWPDNMELWEDYWEIFTAALKEQDDAKAIPAEATAFYREHRAELDQGCVVAWDARKRKDELSAIQHAMNLYLRNPSAFASEYQNEPLLASTDDVFLSADEIATKVTDYKRRQVPQEVTYVTAFVDVHKRILYWAVCGWSPNFTGFVLDYGAFPKPNRPTFTEQRCRPTLAETFKGAGVEAAIYKGLGHVTGELLGRTWERDDQGQLQVGKLLIDTSWDTETIRKFCRESPHKALLMPAFGREFGPNSLPISQWKKRAGEVLGFEWKIQKRKGRETPHVLFDANVWKVFMHRRLATPIGDPGALSLFGRETNGTRADHNFFARHLDCEYRTQVQGTVRQVDLFSKRPGSSQNHWLDCVVGNCVAASLLGASVVPAAAVIRQKRSLKQRRDELLARKKTPPRRAA